MKRHSLSLVKAECGLFAEMVESNFLAPPKFLRHFKAGLRFSVLNGAKPQYLRQGFHGSI
jgi:hypothetical protein